MPQLIKCLCYVGTEEREFLNSIHLRIAKEKCESCGLLTGKQVCVAVVGNISHGGIQLMNAHAQLG